MRGQKEYAYLPAFAFDIQEAHSFAGLGDLVFVCILGRCQTIVEFASILHTITAFHALCQGIPELTAARRHGFLELSVHTVVFSIRYSFPAAFEAVVSMERKDAAIQFLSFLEKLCCVG